MMLNRSNLGMALLLTAAAAFVASGPRSAPWTVVVSSLALVAVVAWSALRARNQPSLILPIAVAYCVAAIARVVLHLVLAVSSPTAEIPLTLAPVETVAALASYAAFAALILLWARAPEFSGTMRRLLALAFTCWVVGWVVLAITPFPLLGRAGWTAASSVAGVLVAFSLVLLAAVSLTRTADVRVVRESTVA
ncbi:hypothetical protein [Microbacterium gorillae]|uniref:hypothetical protein n=1 Tax=Microbacterium gorillae TaxID=1231063 RepID=UPI003D9870DD